MSEPSKANRKKATDRVVEIVPPNTEVESQESLSQPLTSNTNHYSTTTLQRFLNDPRHSKTEAALALQRTYGNRVVGRVLAAQTTQKKAGATVQRAPALPSTVANLATKTPAYQTLKTEADALYNWTNDAITNDIEDQNSAVGSLQVFKPLDLTRAKFRALWSYDEADKTAAGIGGKKAKAAAKLVAREKTVKYFLLNTIREEVAKSAARRIKKNADQQVIALSQQMAVEAAQNGKTDVIDSSTDGPELKKYKEKILKTYEHRISKQKQLAQTINTKIAFEIAKYHVKNNDPMVNQYIASASARQDYSNALYKPLKQKLKAIYNEKITKPIASLRRKNVRVHKLKTDIDGNSTMWDRTKRKYKNELEAEATKLANANYQANLFNKAATIDADMDKIAQTEASTAVEPYKFKAGEEILKKFKAGAKNVLNEDNTASRRGIKDAVTATTINVLKGNVSQSSDYNAFGKMSRKEADIDVGAKKLIKKAQTEAIKETLEGPVHSRLRYVGKAVAPIIPQDGDKAKLEFTLKVPVGDPQGGGYLGMRLLGQVEHEIEWDEKKVKNDTRDTFMPRNKTTDGKDILKADTFKVKAELVLIGGYRVPFVFDVGGEIGGYLEIESDKGMERAMELLSFGFYRRFRESKTIPHLMTDSLWGMGGQSAKPNKSKSKAKTKEAKAWGKAFQESLSDKEFVETGMLGAATGSASITGLANFKGGIKGYTGKRYAKQTMAALAKGKAEAQKDLTDNGKTREKNLGRHMNGAELSSEFNIGPFGFAFKLKGSWMDNQAGSNLDAKYQPDQIDATIQNLDTQIGLENDPIKKAVLEKEKASATSIRHLLKRQMYSLETEASAASKGGNLGSPAYIAAEALKWSAELGSKVRMGVMSFKDQYGKDKKGKNIGAGFFGSAMTAIDAGINNTKSYDPTQAASKLQAKQDLINQQMGQSLSGAAHNQAAIDKMSTFASNSASGLKLTFKHSTKRDFASEQPGAKYSKDYPSKFELILDQVTGGTLGTQIAVVSLEKASRLLRIGVKYKDGNLSLMTM